MITYYKAIVWHLFLIKLERYEPGIVDKIAKYCGVLLNIPRKTFIASWLPVFQEYTLVNISTFIRLTYQQQKQLCESMPIYDGHFLDYIKSITNMEVTTIWHDVTEIEHNKEKLANYMNLYCKHWGLFTRHLEAIAQIDSDTITLFINTFIKEGDLIPVGWWDTEKMDRFYNYVHAREYLKHSAPTHMIEIIPSNEKEPIVLKGLFVEAILRKKQIFITTTDTTGSSPYVKQMTRYFDTLVDDL